MFQQGQTHLNGRQAVRAGQAKPARHARNRAVSPDNNLGRHAHGGAVGRGQQHSAARAAFTANSGVTGKNPRAAAHGGAGKGLIKHFPVDHATGGAHILYAAAMQKAAHACCALHDIFVPHIGLTNQHGRDVFRAAHGPAHYAPPFGNNYGSPGQSSRSRGA